MPYVDRTGRAKTWRRPLRRGTILLSRVSGEVMLCETVFGAALCWGSWLRQ